MQDADIDPGTTTVRLQPAEMTGRLWLCRAYRHLWGIAALQATVEWLAEPAHRLAATRVLWQIESL